jgi:glycosyltransferase involved in cell wall biosynthesis
VPEEHTSVVYLGYDRLVADGERQDRSDMPPFLLHVGSRGGYKNFDALLRAYAASDWLKENFSIVAFGGGAFSVEEQALMRVLGVPAGRVMQVGGGDAALARLYRHAAALVYPSLYEGFGIPPLEAMSLDCPVLCSGRSSIPEVVGDAGEYFDPEDPEAMRVAIESVLESPSRRDELIAKGRARSAGFSWERCAGETHEIYRSMM